MSGESVAQILPIKEEYILRFLHFLVMGLGSSLAHSWSSETILAKYEY